MLNPYLRKLDTASLSNRINNAGLPTSGNATGNIMYWNGSAWIKLPIGSEGQILKVSGGLPAWGNADFYCGLTTLKDIDNNTYSTVQIGTQCWMAENLRVRKYNDGTNIPFDASGGTNGNGTGVTWSSLTYGAHTLYGHDSTATSPSNLTKYGYLYNWYAVGSMKLCPLGWHVPSVLEWTELINSIGPNEGTKLKENSSLWALNTGTDDYNFSARPGGFRSPVGEFFYISLSTFFWSTTEGGTYGPYYYYLDRNSSSLSQSNSNKTVGTSIRCIKD
jgi:uncharacterized protein (TIGR02145 family)